MDRTRVYMRVGSRPDRRYRQYGNMRLPCLVRIISVVQLWNCFHTLLFSSVTLTPLWVNTAGKSPSVFELWKVVNTNEGNNGGDCGSLTRLVSVHIRDADASCEVAWSGSVGLWHMVGDATAGLAGLASAGEDREVELQLLVMETALFSISVSLVKLGPVVFCTDGVEDGTDVGGKGKGLPVMPPSSRSRGSSIVATLESMAGITSACGSFTSLIPDGESQKQWSITR